MAQNRISHGKGATSKRVLKSIALRYRDQKRINQQLLAEIAQKQRLLQVFSGYCHAVGNASSEIELFTHFCHFAVKQGGYLLAWVGEKQFDAQKTVKPIAWDGVGVDYIAEVQVNWSETDIHSHGPSGRAIRGGRTEYCSDTTTDPHFLPWLELSKRHGFRSMLAVPLKPGNEIYGSINFYSANPDAFRALEIEHLEMIANQITLWLYYNRESSKAQELEWLNRRALESRIAIAAMLEVSLEPINMNAMLASLLKIILSVPWLSLESKGSIFLADPINRTLRLAAQHNLSPQLLEKCRIVPYGYCLCGRAAQEHQIVFSPTLDEQHDVTFVGIMPHGHYCVPILSQNKLLGILNLYVTDGHSPDPEEQGFLATVGNTLSGIIERKIIEDEMSRLVRFDSLTGFLNRRSFYEELTREITRARREKRDFALLYIDLDGFKKINDTFGHPVGDELLKMVCSRISTALRMSDTLARMGGDEFCVLLVGMISESHALAVAGKIVSQLGEEFRIGQHVCQIGCSIGISLYPAHSTTPEDLVRRADMALYDVKRTGRNHAKVYHVGMEMGPI
ncbi:MAG: diguanylate cyclase [Magnetococcales bacterium]|nr:diguanylate cyclase [Magnetococcales bacterium]